ncbi:SH3 domain-containing protein [Lachnospiraceae bacterium 62-35]
MKTLKWKKGAAITASLLLALQPPAAGIIPLLNTYAYTEKNASVNASTLNVRSGPGTSNSIVTKLSMGTAVVVTGEATASDGALWYQIRFTGSGGQQMSGYASKSYIKFKTEYRTDGDFEAFLNAEGFPESYKEGLRALHAEYPQWVFRAHRTGLDWNTVIENESVVGRNLVSKNSISSWKSTAEGAYNWSTGTWPGFDGSAWVAASPDIIRYYMDPRNFLDEHYVFQFLRQTYDGSVQTVEGLQTMLKGTFMEGGALSGSGVNGNSGVSSGNGNSGSPGENGTSDSSSNIGPGGRDTLTIPSQSSPENKPSNNKGSGSTRPDSSAPTSGGNPGITFEGPRASLDRKQVYLLSSSVGPGASISGEAPGGSSDSSSQTSGNSTVSGSGTISYAEAIRNAGIQSGVNPYVLAAMIIQEVGKGGSRSVTGTSSGYEGYYNFYNIGAYTTDTMDAITRGLWYASQSGSYGRPWNTREKAIIGGAQFYGDNYVKAGQDTFYLKKFNVQGSNIYKHQYMGNVVAAASEGYHMSEAYNDTLKKSALEFKIPIYNNMPTSPCAKPALDGSPNNKLSGLGVEGYVLTPTFHMDVNSYDIIVGDSTASVNIWASAVDSKASVSGTGTISLQSGSNEIKVNVKAENGSVREYILRIVRQGGGTSSEGSAPVSSSPGETPGGPGAVSGPGEGSPSGEVKSPLG